MNYGEFIEHCDKNGIDPIGKDVWVTDVRLSQKEELIRNIHAERFVIVPASDAGRTIYYADHVLQKYGKKGKPIKQFISIYDTTGFRSYPGVSVNIYFNERDAKEKLIQQLENLEYFYNEKSNEYNKKAEGYLNQIAELKQEGNYGNL